MQMMRSVLTASSNSETADGGFGLWLILIICWTYKALRLTVLINEP